jgi:hypothetical protein
MNWGLKLPIWNLEARIPLFGWSWNSSLETGQNSEPNPPCVILASYISELPRSELAGIVKTSKNKKNVKYKKIKKSKTFNNKKYEKFKNQKKSKIVKNQRL